jgi:ketopantoate reductase
MEDPGDLSPAARSWPDPPLAPPTSTTGAFSTPPSAGRPSSRRGEPRSGRGVARAADALRSTGLLAEARPDARPVLWRKLVLNSAVNPVTAIAHCPNGTILHEPALFEIARGAAREAARVGQALRIVEADYDAEEALRAILRETAGNLSSTEVSARRRQTRSRDHGRHRPPRGGSPVPAPVQEALLTLIAPPSNARRGDPAPASVFATRGLRDHQVRLFTVARGF